MASTARVWRRFGDIGTRSILMIAVLFALVIALERIDWRFDWSVDARFSLQEPMLAIIDEIEHEVDLVGIWPQHGLRPQMQELTGFLEQRLPEIAGLSPRLRFRAIDAELDRVALSEFRRAHPTVLGSEGPVTPGIYVVGQGRPFHIPLAPMLRVSLQRELGGALITTADSERTPLYLLQGHGELDARADAGIGAALHRLALAGFAYDPDLGRLDEAALSRRSIPHDGLLIIAGPSKPLGASSIAALHDYLVAGGSLLLLADHRCPDDLAALLARWGVHIAGAYSARLNASLPPLEIKSIDYSLRLEDQRLDRLQIDPAHMAPEHPITRASRNRGQAAISPGSTPIAIDAALLAPPADDASAEQRQATAFQPPRAAEHSPLLMLTNQEAWLAPPENKFMPDAPQPDQTMALVVAHALALQPHPDSPRIEHGARLVLWGSREAAAARWVGDSRWANEQLLADMAAWAVRREAATPIAEQRLTAFRVETSDGAIDLLMVLLVAVIPAACVGIAIITWWERR